MDPFSIIWICWASVIVLAGSAYAAKEPDFETAASYVGVSFLVGGGFPIFLCMGLVALVIGVLFAPFLVIRFFAQRQTRRELKFQNLDAELNRHLDESHQLAKK